jgi:hypothetical protein
MGAVRFAHELDNREPIAALGVLRNSADWRPLSFFQPLPTYDTLGAGSVDWRTDMTIMQIAKRSGRGLAAAAALAAVVSLSATPNTAYAGGIGTGAAVGIGLGAFALGSALGAGAYGYPYGYGYGYGYYPQTAYYPAAPYYPAPRSCWNPYYRNYYAC